MSRSAHHLSAPSTLDSSADLRRGGRRSRRLTGALLVTAVAGLVAAGAPSAFAQAKQDPSGGTSGCSWGGVRYDHGATRTITYYVNRTKITQTLRCNNGMWDVVLEVVSAPAAGAGTSAPIAVTPVAAAAG